MEDWFSLLIKDEHKAHWVIDLCQRSVWCLARNGERQTDRETESKTMAVMSWVMAHALQTARQHATTCATVPKFTLIQSFVCVMIKTKKEGPRPKWKQYSQFLTFSKRHLLFFFSLPLFFCVFGVEPGRWVELFLSDLGNKCGGGTSEGALFWLCLPTFDQEHTGPWLDSSSTLLGDSAPTGAASDKTARAFGNQSILHTAGKTAFKTQNTKL